MRKRFELFKNDFLYLIHDNETNIDYTDFDYDILTDLLNKQDMQIKEFKQIMEKHNIIGLTKLDACLADYLNVNKDTMAGKIMKQQKEEIKQLKFDCAMYKSANYLINDIGIDKAKEIMFQTEKELKQSQNSKAIEVLEKVRKFYNSNSDSDWIIDLCELDDFIKNQITELRGENNGKL